MYNLTRRFDFVNNFNDFFQDFVHVETNKPLDLEVDVAGIAAKDITVHIEGSDLIIKGETNGRKLHEVHMVPRNINMDELKVTYDHGLLFIKAPTISRKIDVKIENTEK